MDSKFCTIKELASELNVSSRTVRRMHDTGVMPRAVRFGRALRWDRREIDRWRDNGCPNLRSRKGVQR